jgi:hypothetical protein
MSHLVHIILSPGTRIVTRNDANRIGGEQFVSVGAVAAITDSSADAQHGCMCLDKKPDDLLTIKRGECPWPDVGAWRLRLHKEFEEAFASTQVPERPDYDWANEFLKARSEMVNPNSRNSLNSPRFHDTRRSQASY